MPETSDLLGQLLLARQLEAALDLVLELEEIRGFSWRAVGNRENNYGHINIGSDPGFALVERVTNAIDAIIEHASETERRSGSKRALPANPREAVERWFAVESGRVRNLKQDDRQHLAEKVTVALLTGSRGRSYPNILVRDLGIGLTPELVPRSILGLGESNKIDKPFLAGAYGQGGSTTFAFSPGGTLIATRRDPELLNGQADRVSVTLVRFRDLDPTVNKNGRYEYLVQADNAVPTLLAKDVPDFPSGTLVLHYNYDLAKYSSALTQLTGSLWWLLQNALFDPVLPLWAEDWRPEVTKKEKVERRSIIGNHARLWSDRRSKLEHTDSVQINLPHPEGHSRVTAHYWVAALPEGSARKSRCLQLPYLDRYLILQIELDHLTPHARRGILSTTRDRLKESHLYEQLRERLAHALAEDPELVRLNEIRKEALLSSYTESERKRMRERFARLLTNLAAGRDASVPSKGDSKRGRRPARPHQRQPLEPLPTGNAPTFIRIANVQKPIRVRIDRAAVLRLESDAPDGYLADHDPSARLVLAAQPEHLVAMESRSDFRGGRARMLIRPGSDAKVGDEGTLDVFLLTPEDSFHDRVSFRITDKTEHETTGDKSKGQVKAPEPVPIYQAQWPQLGWDETSVARVEEDATGARILVNLDNRHISRLLQMGGYKETGLNRMKNNYLLYSAYYAWLQHRALEADDHGLSGEDFEKYQHEELDRAAQTVVSAIAAEGRLD